jgi:N-acyl-D-amino-acid deacylase
MESNRPYFNSIAMKKIICFLLVVMVFVSCQKKKYDIVIRQGTLYDGSGAVPVVSDVGINADTIAAIGDLSAAIGTKEIDAKGLAVAPGFVNMLSQSMESLLIDGNSQSDIRQGVTLEIMGEGESQGPLTEKMKEDGRRYVKRAGLDYAIDWTTLDEYLRSAEKKGISTNIASFVGATTVRVHELGYENRLPNAAELDHMKALVRQAMEEGALGVGSSLIYAPANYSSTEELIELCKVAGEYGGMYITHMRSEGNSIMSAIDETTRIAREAKVPAEIWHLKLAGKDNWNKLDDVVAKIATANAEGLRITADMYTYPAGSTGLDATMPPWIQAGGIHEWIRRMKDPKIRQQALAEMRKPSDKWENLLQLSGSPDRVLLVEFSNDSLKKFTGKTLAEVSKIYGKSPEETAMDLVIADSTRVGTVYFMMDEENIKRQIALPYVSFGSDAASMAPEGYFIKSNTHPRAYGNFARLLGKYVRDEKVIPLEEAVRRLTSLPTSNMKIRKRGLLKPGYFADVVVFNPAKVQDYATFEKPHQYSAGMVDVFVNGTQVLAQGEHTGAHPGRAVRGPGWRGNGVAR